MNVVTRVLPRLVAVSCVNIAVISLSLFAPVYASDTTATVNLASLNAVNLADNSLPEANAPRTPTIAAVLETRFMPTQHVYERLRIQLSESGFRFEDMLDGVGMVANYDTANRSLNAWFVDPVREVVHKIPLLVAEDAPALPSVEIRLPHHIDSTPCVGGAGHHVDDKLFKDRRVQVWHCTPVRKPQTVSSAQSTHDNHSELFNSKEFLVAQRSLEAEWPVEQYYDDALNLVVYSRNSTGFESELMYIRTMDPDTQKFTPPESYQQVSIEEYLSWDMPDISLEDYKL